MAKRAVKKWVCAVLALCMIFALAVTAVACNDDPDDGTTGEVHVYDGAFIGSADGNTWYLKLKEDGTYYNQHLFSETAGTWKLLDEDMQYNSATVPSGLDEDLDNPVYKTATQVIELAEYGGKTIKYPYAEDKIWGVEMDWGMSHKILTHDPDYEWDESTETPVVVEQFYMQKDSSKSVALNHDGSFQDSINTVSGTWTVADGVYTLTARNGTTYTLTPSQDGATAEYKSGSGTVTLYETAISSIYAFNGKVTAVREGGTDAKEYEFRLSLYENGDADIGFYDVDDNLKFIATESESGSFTYEDEVFAFDFADSENDNTNVVAAGGIYSYIYTVPNGFFEQTEGKSVTVTLTYEQPPIYVLEGVLAEGQDAFASATVGEFTATVPAMELRVFANGKAAVYFDIDVMGTPFDGNLLDEGTWTGSGNNMTFDFTNGSNVTTSIDKDKETVNATGYTFENVVIADLGNIEFDFTNVTFQMDYEPAATYTFTASNVTAANEDTYESFTPESIELVCLDNGSYNIVVTIAGQEFIVETGVWELQNDKTIDFTKEGATEVSYSSTLSGIIATVSYSGAMKVNDTIDYGNVTATFVCRDAAFNVKSATLAGVKPSSGNYGTAKIVYDMFTMTVIDVSLDLYSDGTAILNATVSINMSGFENVPGGTLDTATYTVSGDTYTFVFENAGTLTGTVTNGTLELEYEGDAVYVAPPELAAMLAAGGADKVPFSGMSFTLTGTIA